MFEQSIDRFARRIFEFAPNPTEVNTIAFVTQNEFENIMSNLPRLLTDNELRKAVELYYGTNFKMIDDEPVYIEVSEAQKLMKNEKLARRTAVLLACLIESVVYLRLLHLQSKRATGKRRSPSETEEENTRRVRFSSPVDLISSISGEEEHETLEGGSEDEIRELITKIKNLKYSLQRYRQKYGKNDQVDEILNGIDNFRLDTLGTDLNFTKQEKTIFKSLIGSGRGICSCILPSKFIRKFIEH